MTANVDTYVLPADSNELLSKILPTTNPLRITWGVLTDEEKEGYLAAALRRLENLHFVGRKVSFWQPLQFPRIAPKLPPDFDNAPLEVKKAQVLWAAEIMRQEVYVKRRNTDACLALGLINSDIGQPENATPNGVKELLHRWITSWRRT